MKLKARLTGFGSYLPQKVLANADLEKLVETSDEWIVSRTGMKERRLAAANEYPSDMGAKAAETALHNAGIKATDVDLILVATMSPDYPSPSTAALIQHQIGAVQAAAFDLQAACTGYLYGLSVAQAYVESGLYQTVLFIATEKMSAFIDYQDRNTCVLFGDGATAVVIRNQGEGLVIEQVSLGADGSLAELAMIPGGGARHPASLETIASRQHYFKMAGKEVFKHAVRRMTAAARTCLEAASLRDQDISWLIPHQANQRIIEAIAKNFDLPLERVFLTLSKYGNTSAASVGIALNELRENVAFSEGEHLLLVAFGGGLTWGAAILTYEKGRE